MVESPINPQHPVIREFYRDASYGTLGEQYNNLGNITQGSSGMWPGQEGIGWSGSDRAFKAFATLDDGIAAQAFLLERYVNRSGDTTFHDIIKRYAPPSENNVGAYDAHVSGNVDAIARQLGYTGPKIDANTDLSKAFGDKTATANGAANGDIVLAATIKAMNEVEVGKSTSDRLTPPQAVLSAVQNKYRKQYGGYEKYAKSIGEDPGVRAPHRTRSGIAQTKDGEWDQPDDNDIDSVMNVFVEAFVGWLLGLFGFDKNNMQERTDAPAPEKDAQLGSLVSAGLLKALGISGAAVNDSALNVFDGNHNGHISRDEVLKFDIGHHGQLNEDDLQQIKQQLQSANVSLPANASAADVLNAFSLQQQQQQNAQKPGRQ